MSVRSIAICASQVPLRSGGAEILVASLKDELVRRGYRTEIVQLPFRWYPRMQILRSCLAWRLLDLTESDGERIDLAIATKFPSYVVRHPHKVVWLVQQFRQIYDHFGTQFSDFTKSTEDEEYRRAIMAVDDRTLREARAVYTISQNVTNRLERFNDLPSRPLYPPPKLLGRYRCDEYGDYIFTVSRLDRAKRLDVLVQAMRSVRSGVRLVIAGTGPEKENLSRVVEELGVHDRVSLVGFVPDAELLDLYARCLAVAYIPQDEDYGYVTVEALSSRKLVVTADDCGGVLEFIRDGLNGYVTDGRPESIAGRFDELWDHRDRTAMLGQAGPESVDGITWDRVIDHLLAP